jgi:NADH-quinone oxidoreductase E subunit
MSKIQEEISIGERGKEELLVLLKDLQSRFGYLPGELLVEIAKSLGISVSEVYGVATFYSFLCTKPQGRNVIRICKSLPCFLKNSDLIIDSINKELGINPGETTSDGRFSFELTNCIGACDKAPAMMINHDVHGELTPERISKILKEYQ